VQASFSTARRRRRSGPRPPGRCRRGADLLGVAGGAGRRRSSRGSPRTTTCRSSSSRGNTQPLRQDLGLDRDDPVACLDALTDGVELRVDLGRIADRTIREQRVVRRLRDDRAEPGVPRRTRPAPSSSCCRSCSHCTVVPGVRVACRRPRSSRPCRPGSTTYDGDSRRHHGAVRAAAAAARGRGAGLVGRGTPGSARSSRRRRTTRCSRRCGRRSAPGRHAARRRR